MARMPQDNTKLNLAPRRFNMWIFIFTSFMFFAALTSAFIVYSGGRGHGLNVILPKVFMFSTAAIMVSSLTMYLANNAAKGLQFGKQRLYLWCTLALGLLFFVLQVYGWYILAYRMNVYFINPNASQSFIYVFSGMHLLHILAGLVLVIVSLTTTYRKTPQVINIFRMEMGSIFWHFVDIIWIYLYVFLLLNQN